MENQCLQILIVDDDREICDLLSQFLIQHNCKVLALYDAQDVIAQLQTQKFDLLILDVMLPGTDGFMVCKEVRKHSELPIIMLTALNDEMDRVTGLEMGADDYLAKPFSPRELLARIKALLRRSKVANPNKTPKLSPLPILHFSGWTVDQNKRRLIAPDGLFIPLSNGEYELLVAFVMHPHEVLNRDQLLNLTHERDAEPFERSVDMLIARLRKKIEKDPKNPVILKTIRGEGYQFIAEVKTL